MTTMDAPTGERPKTSTRDYEELRTQLQDWLRATLPGAVISELVVPESNGMSSETVLFDVTTAAGADPLRMVARIAPDPEADRQRLVRHAVEVVAALHQLSASGPASFLAGPDDGESHLRHHVREPRAYYHWVAADGVRSPLIERGFEWLEEHWPEGDDDVFSWGDGRIGNMMFEDFAPVAVLDWEMAAIGPARSTWGG
jgi:aminoglycoside phosphotransferase (APT) family kinase protein